MDDRQHADLANTIRDKIIETWPEYLTSLNGFRPKISSTALRTVITTEIGKWRETYETIKN